MAAQVSGTERRAPHPAVACQSCRPRARQSPSSSHSLTPPSPFPAQPPPFCVSSTMEPARERGKKRASSRSTATTPFLFVPEPPPSLSRSWGFCFVFELTSSAPRSLLLLLLLWRPRAGNSLRSLTLLTGRARPVDDDDDDWFPQPLPPHGRGRSLAGFESTEVQRGINGVVVVVTRLQLRRGAGGGVRRCEEGRLCDVGPESLLSTNQNRGKGGPGCPRAGGVREGCSFFPAPFSAAILSFVLRNRR